MGGAPCKVVIDNGFQVLAAMDKYRAALGRALGCMNTSILLHYETTSPTPAMQDEFAAKARDLATTLEAKAEALAQLAAQIEKYSRTADEGGAT